MSKFFSDIKKYTSYIFYAAKTELKAEVANSYLNWLWWILEPLCFMLIYSFVFKFFFRGTIEYLTPFIFIGVTLWEFFSKMLKGSVKLVRSSKPIISKIYVPKYVLIIEKMAINIFKTAISFVIVILLLIVNRVPVSWYMLWTFPVLLSFMIFVFGVCTIFFHFGVYIDDLANVTDIALKLFFYATGVFYDLNNKLSGNVGYYLSRLNPIAMYLTSVRDSLLSGKTPDLMWLGIWTLTGIVLSIIGVILIQKNENNYVKVI